MPFINLAKAYVDAARDPGSVHNVTLDDMIGLRVRKIKGDGKCMWYALVIARSLNAGATLEDIDDLDATGVFECSAKRLRLKVCNELWDKEKALLKEQYRPFFAPGEEGTEEALSELEYVRGLWTGRVFAGALELHVASILTQSSIAVLNRDASGASISVYRPRDVHHSPTPIMLVRSDMHYDAIALPESWHTLICT